MRDVLDELMQWWRAGETVGVDPFDDRGRQPDRRHRVPG